MSTSLQQHPYFPDIFQWFQAHKYVAPSPIPPKHKEALRIGLIYPEAPPERTSFSSFDFTQQLLYSVSQNDPRFLIDAFIPLPEEYQQQIQQRGQKAHSRMYTYPPQSMDLLLLNTDLPDHREACQQLLTHWQSTDAPPSKCKVQNLETHDPADAPPSNMHHNVALPPIWGFGTRTPTADVVSRRSCTRWIPIEEGWALLQLLQQLFQTPKSRWNTITSPQTSPDAMSIVPIKQLPARHGSTQTAPTSSAQHVHLSDQQYIAQHLHLSDQEHILVQWFAQGCSFCRSEALRRQGHTLAEIERVLLRTLHPQIHKETSFLRTFGLDRWCAIQQKKSVEKPDFALFFTLRECTQEAYDLYSQVQTYLAQHTHRCSHSKISLHLSLTAPPTLDQIQGIACFARDIVQLSTRYQSSPRTHLKLYLPDISKQALPTASQQRLEKLSRYWSFFTSIHIYPLQDTTHPSHPIERCVHCGAQHRTIAHLAASLHTQLQRPLSTPKPITPRKDSPEIRIRLHFGILEAMTLYAQRDLHALLEDLLFRSGLPLKPTPTSRIKARFTSTPPKGMASLAEYMDIFLYEHVDSDFVLHALRNIAPCGLRFFHARRCPSQQRALSKQWDTTVYAHPLPAERTIQDIEQALQQPLHVQSSKGPHQVHLRSSIWHWECTQPQRFMSFSNPVPENIQQHSLCLWEQHTSTKSAKIQDAFAHLLGQSIEPWSITKLCMFHRSFDDSQSQDT